MKKNRILLLLMSLLTTYSFSQTKHSQIQLIDENVMLKHSMAKSVKTYLLDSTLVFYQFKSSEVPDEKSEVNYSDNFDRISKILKYQSASFTSYELYKYGNDDVNCDDGLIIKYFDVSSSGNDYENTREMFEYEGDSCEILSSFARELYNSTNQIWENNRKKVYAYNENGTIDYIQTQYEDGWNNLFKDTYLYNNDASIDRIYRVQNTETENDSLLRTSYHYNSDGYIESIIEETFIAANVWENNYRILFTYDDHGNVTEKLSQKGYGGAWEDNFRYFFEYDEQINIEDLFYSYEYKNSMTDFLQNNMKHPVKKIKVQMKYSKGWEDASIWNFYYSKNPTISVEDSNRSYGAWKISLS